MNSIAQRCRPKHQVLILKCYPATTKGAVDVNPNSSELSYLLYYATTRRSKVQKVGAFLEKKTATDVWRARIGNVQVTLQILKALIEKAPRDLPLYAPFVVKILILILRSRDITMVEASLPTFEAFCEHHDGASLSADQDYLQQYGEVIRIYASFASTRPQPAKAQPSAPMLMRWRKAGLHAILSIASSEALASVAGRQLNVVMPVLLENLWTENEDYLFVLQERAQLEGNGDIDKLLRRRMSATTVQTMDTSEVSAAALSGSAADADKLAEEDLGVLAMYCLKQLFETNNRSQIRNATIQTLDFIAERLGQGEKVIIRNAETGEARGWAPTLFGILSRWTLMQDRYVILVTAMETLVQHPLQEENMKYQLVLATMIDTLLRSDINLIGLSVMDVLQGLLQHVLRILQLGGTPHSFKDMTNQAGSKAASAANPITELVAAPSASRRQLLVELQNCIGGLATHIYYADQVTVMMKAILFRLKPAPLSAVPTPSAAIDAPEAATSAIAASGNLSEDQGTDGFFSFDTAKITALNSVKQILLVANHRSKISGGANLGRNQVNVTVWEGTQWLLRDSDPRVRRAYADALLTWLDLEPVRGDLKVFDDKAIAQKGARGREESFMSQKRVVSSASHHREKSPYTFLQLLHLAIYDNVLQFVVSEPDLVMLHILLTNLVAKLGVNAVHSGLPMIFRLQEDIQEVDEPISKFRIGALCHGYFWALSAKFDFQNTAIGNEILSEVNRRRRKGLWMKQVVVPAPTLAEVPAFSTAKPTLSLEEIEFGSLKPFDDRIQVVECIAESYTESVASPPQSPPTSPSRVFSKPILGSGAPPTSNAPEITTKMREDMLSEWSREIAIAAAQESGKSGSPPASRSETQANSRNFLAASIHHETSNGNTPSPQPRNGRSPSQMYGLTGVQKLRKSSMHDSSPTRGSISSHNDTARVDQLKKALASNPVGVPVSRGRMMTSHSDASSESMVSYTFTASEVSYGHQDPPNTARASTTYSAAERSRSKNRGDVATGGAITIDQYLDEIEGDDHQYIPPVPPLPSTFSFTSSNPSQNVLASAEPFCKALKPTMTPVREAPGTSNSNAGERIRSKSRGAAVTDSWGSALTRDTRPQSGVDSMDLEGLLRGIETGGGDTTRGLVGRERSGY